MAPRKRRGGQALTLSDGLKVLVVDDERKTLSALRRNYEGRGLEVQTAPSAREALNLVDGWSPDVAIVDLHLEGLNDGLELIKALRGLFPCCWLVLFSVAVTVEIVSKARDFGANTVVNKSTGGPFDYLGVSSNAEPVGTEFPTLEEMKRRLFVKALVLTDGNFTAAGRLLGVDRHTVKRNIEKWGLPTEPNPDS